MDEKYSQRLREILGEDVYARTEASLEEAFGSFAEELRQGAEENTQALAEENARLREEAAQQQAEASALRERMKSAAYEYAARRAADSLSFTSHAAREAYLTALKEAALPLSDGSLTGLDAFTESFRQTDPGVFASAESTISTGTAHGTGGSAADGVEAAFLAMNPGLKI